MVELVLPCRADWSEQVGHGLTVVVGLVVVVAIIMMLMMTMMMTTTTTTNNNQSFFVTVRAGTAYRCPVTESPPKKSHPGDSISIQNLPPEDVSE